MMFNPFFAWHRHNVQPSQYAFVVRIWDERADAEGNIVVWRGVIEHVEHKKRLHFDDLTEMVRFIKSETGIKEATQRPWWRSLLTRLSR